MNSTCFDERVDINAAIRSAQSRFWKALEAKPESHLKIHSSFSNYAKFIILQIDKVD
jgi:hypothetical protein